MNRRFLKPRPPTSSGADRPSTEVPRQPVGRHVGPGGGWLDWASATAIAAVTGLILLGAVLDGGTPFVGLLAAAPLAAAAFSSPRSVGVAAAYTVGAGVAVVGLASDLHHPDNLVRLAGLALACGLAVTVSYSRCRREHLLEKFQISTRGLHAALHRPVPRCVDGFTFASSNVPVDADTGVGGDVVEVVETPFGLRALVADVCGHGPLAVGVAAGLTVTFRETAPKEQSLAELAKRLDSFVTEASSGRFVTALLLELRGRVVKILNFGHHAPLLVTDSSVSHLSPSEHHVPLGFGSNDPPLPVEVDLSGDMVLAYTDGVVEARGGRDRSSFDLVGALPSWLGHPPARLVGEILAAVYEHTDGRLTDDVALLAIQRTLEDDATQAVDGLAPSGHALASSPLYSGAASYNGRAGSAEVTRRNGRSHRRLLTARRSTWLSAPVLECPQCGLHVVSSPRLVEVLNANRLACPNLDCRHIFMRRW